MNKNPVVLSIYRILAVVAGLLKAAPERALQAYSSFRLCASSQLRYSWLALISVLAVLLISLPRFGFLREDLQAAAFPLLFISYLLLPRQPAFRVPAPLMVLAFALWFGSFLHLRGLAFENGARSQIFFARLDKDKQGLAGRGLYHRYRQIARTYDVHGARMLHRGIGTNELAARWLAEKHPESPFIVRGEPQWLELVFNPRLQTNTGGHFAARSVEIAWAGKHFQVGSLPAVLHVPGKPKDLALHFTAWLAQALGEPIDLNEIQIDGPEQGRAAELALRRDALAQISGLEGVWLSSSPFGLANYLLATFDLLEAVEQDSNSSYLYHSAVRRYRRAAAQVHPANDPELFALLFNNAAVAKLASAEDIYDIFKARDWFWTALGAAEQAQSVPLGSRLALENLLRFEEIVRIVDEG